MADERVRQDEDRVCYEGLGDLAHLVVGLRPFGRINHRVDDVDGIHEALCRDDSRRRRMVADVVGVEREVKAEHRRSGKHELEQPQLVLEDASLAKRDPVLPEERRAHELDAGGYHEEPLVKRASQVAVHGDQPLSRKLCDLSLEEARARIVPPDDVCPRLLRRGKQPLAGIGRNGIVAVDEQDVVSRCGVDRHVARRRLAPVGLVEHLDVCVALGIAVTQLTRAIG